MEQKAKDAIEAWAEEFLARGVTVMNGPIGKLLTLMERAGSSTSPFTAAHIERGEVVVRNVLTWLGEKKLMQKLKWTVNGLGSIRNAVSKVKAKLVAV